MSSDRQGSQDGGAGVTGWNSTETNTPNGIETGDLGESSDVKVTTLFFDDFDTPETFETAWEVDGVGWRLCTEPSVSSGCASGTGCSGTCTDESLQDTDGWLISLPIAVPKLENAERLMLRYSIWYNLFSQQQMRNGAGVGVLSDAVYVAIRSYSAGITSDWGTGFAPTDGDAGDTCEPTVVEIEPKSISGPITTAGWGPDSLDLTAAGVHAPIVLQLGFRMNFNAADARDIASSGEQHGVYLDNIALRIESL